MAEPELLATDLYGFESLLEPDEWDVVLRTRVFIQDRVGPIANRCRAESEFPHHLFGELDIIGLSIAEAGRPPSSRLLTGFIALELSRTPTLSPAAGVPEANRLAEANSFSDSGKVLRQTRGGVAVAWSAVWCQIGAYELAVAYAVKRGQFGRPIGHCQLMQDLLVRMLGNITASLGLVVRVAQLQEDGVFRDEHAALAKAYTTSRLRETVAWASELFGSNGNLVDHGIARFFADAEALYSYEGSREVNHLIVGRSITGKGAFV